MKEQPTETAFVAKIREQIGSLKGKEDDHKFRVYVCGIGEPWVFRPADQFQLDGEKLVVRMGPAGDYWDEGVTEVVFPLQHVVATELAVSEDEEEE